MSVTEFFELAWHMFKAGAIVLVVCAIMVPLIHATIDIPSYGVKKRSNDNSPNRSQ